MITMMDMRTLLNRIFPTLYSLVMWHSPFISPEFMSLSPPNKASMAPSKYQNVQILITRLYVCGQRQRGTYVI
jgi:hypothetical protein